MRRACASRREASEGRRGLGAAASPGAAAVAPAAAGHLGGRSALVCARTPWQLALVGRLGRVSLITHTARSFNMTYVSSTRRSSFSHRQSFVCPAGSINSPLFHTRQKNLKRTRESLHSRVREWETELSKVYPLLTYLLTPLPSYLGSLSKALRQSERERVKKVRGGSD